MHPERENYVPRYRVIRRPLKSGNLLLQPGEPIAHAERWTRVDAWVRARIIEPI